MRKLTFGATALFAMLALIAAPSCSDDDDDKIKPTPDASLADAKPATAGTTGSAGTTGGGGAGATGTAGTPGTGGAGAPGTGGAGAPGKTPDAGVDAGGDVGAVVSKVTYVDVKPIFVAKCSACHTTGKSGGHNIGADYADAIKASQDCPGKKIGECALAKVMSGSMPFAKGCSGTPATDKDKAFCLTASELKSLEDWVAGGLLEK